MTRGRKPKPRPRASREATPPATQRLPDPPAELDAVESAEWRRLAAVLQDEGLAADVDQGLLVAYCIAYGRWRRAHSQVAQTGGEIVKSPSGYPIQNPWLSIANTAHKQMVQLAAEFGLSPTSRTRLRKLRASI